LILFFIAVHQRALIKATTGHERSFEVLTANKQLSNPAGNGSQVASLSKMQMTRCTTAHAILHPDIVEVHNVG